MSRITVDQAVAYSIVTVDPQRVADIVATSTLTVEGQTRYAMLDSVATPAEGTTAARVILNTLDIEFSHMAMGAYPVYTPRKHDAWGAGL